MVNRLSRAGREASKFSIPQSQNIFRNTASWPLKGTILASVSLGALGALAQAPPTNLRGVIGATYDRHADNVPWTGLGNPRQGSAVPAGSSDPNKILPVLQRASGARSEPVNLRRGWIPASQGAERQYVDGNPREDLPPLGSKITGELAVNAGGFTGPRRDNLTMMDFNQSRINIQKQSITGSQQNPLISVNYVNHNRPYAYGSGPDIPAALISAESAPGSSGQVNALDINLYSLSDHPYVSEDQAVNVQIRKYRQSSTWAYVSQSLDFSGLPPESFAQVGNENDLGSGPFTRLGSA
jgi:hypothetical protein